MMSNVKDPRSKLQAPEKHQISSSNPVLMFRIWTLVLLWILDLGSWILDLGARCFDNERKGVRHG